MTSPTRRNRRHTAYANQDRLPPPVPQPNFMPAIELQAGPVPQPFAWQPPPHFPHAPLPVAQYPGLPRNAIAHVLHAHRPPPVDYNARLNEQMNAAGNNRLQQRNIRRQQKRLEIRQQAQAELMAAGMQPPNIPHIPNEPIQPVPPVLPAPPVHPVPPVHHIPPVHPVPPVYGPIHHEGAVGLHDQRQIQYQLQMQAERLHRQAQQQEAERQHRQL